MPINDSKFGPVWDEFMKEYEVQFMTQEILMEVGLRAFFYYLDGDKDEATKTIVEVCK